MKLTAFLCCILSCFYSYSQKVPLDHSVYDGWQSIGERLISNDGKWIVYSITPQEGDACLYILSSLDTSQKISVPRGYGAEITEDSRFVVFRIKPGYKETREAKIKKKKSEDMPKDSLGIVQLSNKEITKWARIRSFKTPEKAGGWVAIQKEKEPFKPGGAPTQKTVDSLKKTIDSLLLLVTEIKNVKAGTADVTDAEDDPASSVGAIEGSDLILHNAGNKNDKVFRNVSEYFFNAYGQKLVMRIT
ncbi:MAG TPA: hypothetical protein VJ499_16520, partial [Flavisolibacter sp.]|nr:hypothetical protein [Flavisolibacter sp.]